MPKKNKHEAAALASKEDLPMFHALKEKGTPLRPPLGNEAIPHEPLKKRPTPRDFPKTEVPHLFPTCSFLKERLGKDGPKTASF